MERRSPRPDRLRGPAHPTPACSSSPLCLIDSLHAWQRGTCMPRRHGTYLYLSSASQSLLLTGDAGRHGARRTQSYRNPSALLCRAGPDGSIAGRAGGGVGALIRPTGCGKRNHGLHSIPPRLWPLAAFSAPDPTRSFDLTSRPTGAKRRATGFSFSSRSIDHSDSMRFDSTRGFFERLDSHHGVAVWQLMAMGACRIHRWIHLFHASSQLCPPRLFFSGVYPGAWNWMRS